MTWLLLPWNTRTHPLPPYHYNSVFQSTGITDGAEKRLFWSCGFSCHILKCSDYSVVRTCVVDINLYGVQCHVYVWYCRITLVKYCISGNDRFNLILETSYYGQRLTWVLTRFRSESVLLLSVWDIGYRWGRGIDRMGWLRHATILWGVTRQTYFWFSDFPTSNMSRTKGMKLNWPEFSI